MKKYYQIITQTFNFSEMGDDFDPDDGGEQMRQIQGEAEASLLLSRLSPIEKRVIELKIHRFSFKEIGEQIGVSEENARKIKQRVKEKLSLYINCR